VVRRYHETLEDPWLIAESFLALLGIEQPSELQQVGALVAATYVFARLKGKIL
jgi:hypothetical protein